MKLLDMQLGWPVRNPFSTVWSSNSERFNNLKEVTQQEWGKGAWIVGLEGSVSPLTSCPQQRGQMSFLISLPLQIWETSFTIFIKTIPIHYLSFLTLVKWLD
jgi:hypothetical protein